MGAYSFWPGMGRDFFKNGNIGVDIFFIISGFIICHATRKKEEHYRSNFIIRRFFRIYPLFFICLSIAWLTYNSGYGYEKYLLSSSLMQNDYSGKAPFFGYNMLYPAWTIAYEVMFYFVFLIGMSLSFKNRALTASLLLVSLMLIIQILNKGEISLYGGFSAYNDNMGWLSPMLTLLGSPMMLEFVIGMLCYLIYSNVHITKKGIASILFLIMSFFSVSMIFFADTRMHGITEKGATASAVFFSLMLLEMSGVYIKSKIITFFSDISFSLYLTHAMILKYYLNYLKTIGITDYPKGIASFLLILSSCILIAYIVHITLEKRFIKAGKKVVALLSENKTFTWKYKKPT